MMTAPSRPLGGSEAAAEMKPSVIAAALPVVETGEHEEIQEIVNGLEDLVRDIEGELLELGLLQTELDRQLEESEEEGEEGPCISFWDLHLLRNREDMQEIDGLNKENDVKGKESVEPDAGCAFQAVWEVV